MAGKQQILVCRMCYNGRNDAFYKVYVSLETLNLQRQPV